MRRDSAPPRAVITGLGIVNALGTGHEQFWPALIAGRRAVAGITRFDPEGLPVSLAAEIHGFEASEWVPRRLMAKSDRFAHFALAASDLAVSDSGLRMDDLDLTRVGICFGNNSGGWDLCERGFSEYYGEGPTMVNPWQATAWFPTAPQGFVSIRWGLRGYSKSFACDRASGASALFFPEYSMGSQ
jgi:3-oxoacyl-(acyl-carrier-protein) synthase